MKDSYRVMYLRSSYPVVDGRLTSGQPVGCVAIRVDGRKVSYGLSVQNPADSFNRAVARELAVARLKENPVTLTVVSLLNSELDMHDITEAVMVSLASEKDVPNRAIKAAKVWMKTFIGRI